MDCSLYGYLSRRTNEELEHFIALYWHLQEDVFYKNILDLMIQVLEERVSNQGR